MITHGAQLITDLRRGTWKITSMTRGTVDLIGSLSSPYRTAATEALLAAFPTQWETIRKYGVAHPEIVPFINEDPMLICSLVEVGKVRWLVGDGQAYIDTIYRGNQNSTMKIKFQRLSSSSDTAICGHRDSTNARCLWIFQAGNVLQCGYGNKYGNMHRYCEIGKTYIVETEKSTSYLYKQHCVEDDLDDTVSLALNNFANSNSSECLYRWNSGKSTPAKIALFNIDENGVNVSEMYPFIRNGEAGMLDIISGTFYPNANTTGQFTIQITDK